MALWSNSSREHYEGMWWDGTSIAGPLAVRLVVGQLYFDYDFSSRECFLIEGFMVGIMMKDGMMQ